MKRASVLLLPLAILSGCYQSERLVADQCKRAQLFQQCLTLVTSGPEVVGNSDWSKVVESCETSAYYQSIRSKENITKECR